MTVQVVEGDTGSADKKAHKKRLKELQLRERELTIQQAELELRTGQLELRDAEHVDRSNWTADVRRGWFRFGGNPIDWNTISEATRQLAMYTRLYQPGNGITVEFSSPGGNVFAGFKFFDELRAMSEAGYPVTTICRGYSASMAGILLQAGDTRIVGPESYLMLHEVSSGAIGKAAEIKDAAELAERLTRHACAVYARGGVFTADEFYEKIARRDVWLNAAQAIEWGLADVIG